MNRQADAPATTGLPVLPSARRANHELADITLEHALRGMRLQTVLRALLVAFVTATVIAVPPVHARGACYVIIGLYAAWGVGLTLRTSRHGSSAIRIAWLTQFVDLGVLAALTLLAGVAAQQSWTADVLKNGFLNPRVCAAVVVPTVLVYLAAAIATQDANAEPWASISLGTFVLASVGAGCICLSAIQRSRVITISGLARDRAHLLDELIGLERRERHVLSEHLHDGALQYVLAARQDLDDIGADAAATLPRVRHALDESSRLLRSTVTELHPTVLDRVGLPAALDDLVRNAAVAGRRTARLDVTSWPRQRTSADTLLFSAARELLSNVAKHSHATSVDVVLTCADSRALLVVTDDGSGLPNEAARRDLADGHVGLASHALRIEAAGGNLAVGPGTPTGTVATVELPYRPLPDGTHTASGLRRPADTEVG